MVDYTLLEQAMCDSGLKFEYIARSLGITVQALRLKRIGLNEFTLGEITALKDVLRLSNEQFFQIFFAKERERVSRFEVTKKVKS